MNLMEFKQLSERKQHHLISKKGVLLSERNTKSFLVFLYQIEGFYIEMFFYKENGVFATLKSFDNLDELSPYLNEINLSFLFL